MPIKDTSTIKDILLAREPRRRLRAWHRRATFDRAMNALIANPDLAFDERSTIFQRLIYGWGNKAYCAEPEFLVASLRAVRSAQGPVLECGSGLSTLLLGVVAASAGTRIWSLEHHPDWAERVRSELARFGVTSVHMDTAPLKDYGSYDWYAPSAELMQERFGVVLCDGPPGDTRGGRSGFLPVMRERLAPQCTIIVDDASRESERGLAEQWARELGASCEVRGRDFPYALIRSGAA